MDIEWKKLEDQVRDLASIIWSRPAASRKIQGTAFDAVIEVSEEEIILIEVTKNMTLDKVRNDIYRHRGVKLNYAAESVLAKCFIILSEEPTSAMIELGQCSKVKVISISEFIREAFDYRTYVNVRKDLIFGSAINPTTGKPDNHDFVPVKYQDESGRYYTVEDLAQKLRRRDKIILLGDYGTGKSRCTREVFNRLSDNFKGVSEFVLSVNLREHWGATTAIEIVAGHLKRLGLSESIDKVMRLLNNGKISLILDGFDEVGSQTFGGDHDRRVSIRKMALQGIRELIDMCSSGILITGRPHYFNGNVEMYESLGISLKKDNILLVNCPDEFDVNQAREYLNKIHLSSHVPKWLPRKPLMFQILSDINKEEAEKILGSNAGEIGFWGQFIDTVCEREAKIHASIDPAYVRTVLMNLAKLTRQSDRELGRLTPRDITQAYEEATGSSPDESGQLMLSRLCTLGRIEPESPDRQFVDPYIVQLLFAESVADDVSNKDFEVLNEKWKQPLQKIGLFFLAQWIDIYALEKDALAIIHRLSSPSNSQVVAELISALMLLDGDSLDFSGLQVKDSDIPILSLRDREVFNIEFHECIFRLLPFEGSRVGEESGVRIISSYIQMATGLTSSQALPGWVENCTVTDIQNASNASRIKSSDLPPAQKLFLSIIQKIFFQRGGGRKQNSLYKGGFGQQYDRKIIEDILNILVNDGYIEKSKDSSGFIYNPKREYTAKMKAIKDQLGLSQDPLWLKISTLK